MGRLLLATELRTAKTYWHVRASGPGVTRIYPEIYASKVVGMLWSMLAQEQTWFGNAPFLAYGIQLMPFTPVAEQRDSPDWVREMLPLFNASCATNPMCETDGWSILIYACQVVIHPDHGIILLYFLSRYGMISSCFLSCYGTIFHPCMHTHVGYHRSMA